MNEGNESHDSPFQLAQEIEMVEGGKNDNNRTDLGQSAMGNDQSME